jgi:Uma2 family endonuclease
LWEAGYKLSDDPPTWIQPDVSFLTRERVLETDPNGYFLGAPDLAVEIISPSESARHIERKIALLLAHGSAAVWVIYPDSRTVHVHTPDRKSISLAQDEVLTLPDFLPGWELPVSGIFA